MHTHIHTLSLSLSFLLRPTLNNTLYHSSHYSLFLYLSLSLFLPLMVTKILFHSLYPNPPPTLNHHPSLSLSQPFNTPLSLSIPRTKLPLYP